jgi:hypothetical protein
VPVFQALLSGVPDYELAVENAQAGIQLCQESLGTPSPTREGGTPEGDDSQGVEEAEATPTP